MTRLRSYACTVTGDQSHVFHVWAESYPHALELLARLLREHEIDPTPSWAGTVVQSTLAVS